MATLSSTFLPHLAALTVLLSLTGCSDPPATSPSSANKTAAPAAEDSSASTPIAEWKLTEEQQALLGEKFEMGQFVFQPPKSFTFIEQVQQGNSYTWVGPVRQDETYPMLMVIIVPLRSVNYPSLEAMLEDSINGIRPHRNSFSSSPIETGMVGDLKFVRSHVVGEVADGAREGLIGRTMHTTLYVTENNNTIVQILCQDVAPDHEPGMAEAEAAAMSFTAKPLAMQSAED
ncbi:hypothetical protein [Aeoliella mucimassa]|uniref:Lipoprotein LpqN n=1 Tax=Aeoliella mucimassa TaxID=2527972 RepID=A0A518AMY8_9BACT|nr:hypothetical protein [Aeoliella mucimassa]QDU56095.1 hypothetical protein Pan181_22990 [Aeoliella mucimassa]